MVKLSLPRMRIVDKLTLFIVTLINESHEFVVISEKKIVSKFPQFKSNLCKAVIVLFVESETSFVVLRLIFWDSNCRVRNSLEA